MENLIVKAEFFTMAIIVIVMAEVVYNHYFNKTFYDLGVVTKAEAEKAAKADARKYRSFWDDEPQLSKFDVESYIDKNYGADADGNRGVSMEFIEGITAPQGSVYAAVAHAIAEDEEYVHLDTKYSDYDSLDEFDFSASDWVPQSEQKEIDRLLQWAEMDKDWDTLPERIFHVLTRNLSYEQLNKTVDVA